MGLLSKWFERGVFAFIVVFLLMFGVFQGVQVQSFTLDLFFVVIEFSWLEAAFSNVSFSVFFVFSFVAFLLRLNFFDSTVARSKGRDVSCIVPTFNDSEQMKSTVSSLLDSNYECLEILIVCVEGDAKAIEAARGISEKENNVNFLVNSENSGSKAENVNLGIRNTSNDIIALFDSDQKVDPDFIGKAVSELDSVRIVQGRNVPLPHGLIGNLSYYQELMFLVPRQLMRKFTGFNLVTSSGVVFEREVINSVGFFDTELLTEDIDFAFRCYRKSISSKNLVDEAVITIPPSKFSDWWKQRKRWMTGYYQVFWKNLKVLFWDLRSKRSIMAVVISVASLSGSFLLITLISKFFLLVFLGAKFIYTLPVISLAVICAVGRQIDYKKHSIPKIRLYWVLAPMIPPLFSLVTVRSFISFLAGSGKWHQIEKK